MERRGAQVVAVDCVEFEEFREAHRMIGSKVDYRILDVEELTPESVGLFDYVLFFGVLYHLRNPLLGLEKICALTRDTAFVESFVTDDGLRRRATMEFYETNELGGQIDNWFGPSVHARRPSAARRDSRASIANTSRNAAPASPAIVFGSLPGPIRRTRPAALFRSKQSHQRRSVSSRQGRIYLRLLSQRCARSHPRTAAYRDRWLGAPALVLVNLRDQEWQANLRVPPGLAPGPHQVRLRTRDSAYSNAFTIVVETPPRAAQRPLGSPRRPPLPTAPSPGFTR